MHIKSTDRLREIIIIGIIGLPLYFKLAPFLGFIMHINPFMKYFGIIVIVVYNPRKNQRIIFIRNTSLYCFKYIIILSKMVYIL